MTRYPQAQPILEAARRWRDECLLGGASIFSEDRIWNAENVDALDRHFVQNLDEGEGTFYGKLKGQLQPARPGAKKLAAEMIWVMYLMVSSEAMGGDLKRLHIRQVWGWSGEDLPDDHWALGEVLDSGISNPGTAYATHRWREFRFFITTMKDWSGLDAAQRRSLLDDPWQFAAWLEEREFAPRRQLRHVLLFLLFPNSFEPALSGHHKREIVRNLSDAADSGRVVNYKDRVAVDREVLAIRERLSEEYDSDDINFYREPIRSQWLSRKPEAGHTPPIDKTAAEAWLRDRFPNARVWVLSPGERARLWRDFRDAGVAALGWDELGDLSELETRDAVQAALAETYGQTNPTNDSLALWQFTREMSPGDVIIAKKGRAQIIGWGLVQGEYRFDDGRSEYYNVRDTEWTALDAPVELPRDSWLPNKTLTEYTGRPEWVKQTFELMEGGEASPPGPTATGGKTIPLLATYTVEEAMRDLFLTPPQFRSILDQLRRRKNVILQGPPGVGKTFIARRIAYATIGRKDPSRIEMVQFHQSYAYEDFVQGWRPNEQGGFTLRNGVFYDFCHRARSDLDAPHVFIIDEINRGNLSRILGELMMLIEADKRGDEHAVPLTYSMDGGRFAVPENVHVLGLMNTADRSLALVDYALRRRFAFVDLKPAFGSEAFAQFLLDAGVEDALVLRISERMMSVNDHIRDDRKNLGPGFEIGHSYFVPAGDEESLESGWYEGIVRTQIEPLIREYWFDQEEVVERLVGELLE